MNDPHFPAFKRSVLSLNNPHFSLPHRIQKCRTNPPPNQFPFQAERSLARPSREFYYVSCREHQCPREVQELKKRKRKILSKVKEKFVSSPPASLLCYPHTSCWMYVIACYPTSHSYPVARKLEYLRYIQRKSRSAQKRVLEIFRVGNNMTALPSLRS